MPQTLAEKIIAQACGRVSVTPGEIVTCRVDLAMIHDSGGPRRVKPILERLGVGVWDAERVVVISDHFAPGFDPESVAILQLTREWVAEQGIPHFYDLQGICHVVLPERGHLKPGRFVVGGDSHSPTGGAFGCFMFGVGATEMAGVLATGEIWLKVPQTIQIELEGTLAVGCCAKDIMLALCKRLGMGGGQYQVIEYTGAVHHLPMAERMTLCNMAAELGGQTGLVAPDEVTAEFVRNAGGGEIEIAAWQGDADAKVLETHTLDLNELVPQVALPHSPANAERVSEVEPTSLHQAYLGACTGAKLEDLQMAAKVLRGRTVAPSTRLFVAPASTRITASAAADGTLKTLTEAGAILLPSGCGACAGYGGGGLLTEGEVCIASTARNFKGRMGANSSEVYLASPYTVAASAITGRITDPRPFLEGAA